MKPKRSSTPTSKRRKRVLIVDDHPLICEGVSRWIQATEDLQVCGQAESASQALSLVEKLKPDLVRTDISLTGRSGLELMKDLQALQPDLPVLVLSMHEEALFAGRALRAGARGYVMKRAGGDRVVEAIREVLEGRIAISREMATLLLEEYSGHGKRSGRAPLRNLTDREFEVFQLLAEARSNREIAEQLHLSPKTVETHRMNLIRKLKLKSAAELMRYALQYADSLAPGQ